MRARFLAAMGPAEELERLRSATAVKTLNAAGLAPVADFGGLLLLASPQTPIVTLPNRQGVLIGTLFDRRSAERLRRLSPAISMAALQSGGGWEPWKVHKQGSHASAPSSSAQKE